jgi:hypothetical protein
MSLVGRYRSATAVVAYRLTPDIDARPAAALVTARQPGRDAVTVPVITVDRVPEHSRRHGKMDNVLRWITAGESHGPALVTILEGMVAGVEVTSDEISAQLARRRLGYGRGARMYLVA